MPTRISDRRVEEIQAEIGRLNTRIEEWNKVLKEKDCFLWGHLSVRLKTAKELAEKDALRSLVEGKIDEARGAAFQGVAYGHTLREVDGVEDNIRKAEEKLAVLREDIKRYKQNHGIVD